MGPGVWIPKYFNKTYSKMTLSYHMTLSHENKLLMSSNFLIPMNICYWDKLQNGKIVWDLKVRKNLRKVCIKGLHKKEAQVLESWWKVTFPRFKAQIYLNHWTAVQHQQDTTCGYSLKNARWAPTRSGASAGWKRLAVFALNPNSVHCQLLPSVHLQSAIHQVLNLFQSSSSEKCVQFI